MPAAPRRGAFAGSSPGGAMAAQPICNRPVRGSSPLLGSTPRVPGDVEGWPSG